MKKKILSIIVTICLVSMAFPVSSVNTNAAEHLHCICGSTTCSGTGHDATQKWEKWTTDNDLPTDDGYYYLTCDVNINYWDLYNADIHLCLNGHTISCERYFMNVEGYNSNVVITNCENDGTIKMKDDTTDNDPMITLKDSANVTINNVTIDKGSWGWSCIEIGTKAVFTSNNMSIVGCSNDFIYGIYNLGTAYCDNLDIDCEAGDGEAIYNEGTLSTNNSSIIMTGNREKADIYGVCSTRYSKWNSTNDDIVATGNNEVNIAANNQGEANIEDTHLKAESAVRGIGLDLDDSYSYTYLSGNCSIEGSEEYGDLKVDWPKILSAKNKDKTKSYSGGKINLNYDGYYTDNGTIIVQDVTYKVSQNFNLIEPANKSLALVDPNLVLADYVAPTTTPAQTTTVKPTTTVAPTTTAKATTVAPTTAAPTQGPTDVTTVAPTTDTPTDVPTVVPTSKEETTSVVETTKPTVKAVKIKKVKKAKKSAKVSWQKLTSKEANGYQIRYSRKKSMKKAKIKTINNVNTGSVKIKKLKRKKKYFFQIRAYLDFNKQRLFSVWSKKKSVKVK